jgi:methionine sulfoxide reductase heme-binding subunit
VPYPWLKPGVVVGALTPLAAIVVRASQGQLGADPVAKVENELGLAALILLVGSLACTPANRLFGWTWAIRIRRELGLLAFFYASLHFLTYVVVDQGVDWRAIVDDIVKRPFITVGFTALVLLVPLALTSTKASIRRLGFRRWQRVHQLTYIAGVLAVIHFVWRVKIDLSQPLTYAAIVSVLLLLRVGLWFYRIRRSRTPPRPAVETSIPG